MSIRDAALHMGKVTLVKLSLSKLGNDQSCETDQSNYENITELNKTSQDLSPPQRPFCLTAAEKRENACQTTDI